MNIHWIIVPVSVLSPFKAAKATLALKLLVIAKQTSECKTITQIRQTLCSNSANISFAAKLWQVFRAIITGALDDLKTILGDTVTLILETIETHIHCFFVQVLQLDLKTLRLEAL